ncbi:MAG: hypothetical protein ABSA71_17635 [Desulfomonilia bacterium]
MDLTVMTFRLQPVRASKRISIIPGIDIPLEAIHPPFMKLIYVDIKTQSMVCSLN